jgi:NNP family nitrate/nitrite transporter-like MFS transporter
MLAACFFPPGFAALSQIGTPSVRNISVSFTVPAGFLIGGGAAPAAIGILGEISSFSLGISLMGVIIMGGVFLSRYLRFSVE